MKYRHKAINVQAIQWAHAEGERERVRDTFELTDEQVLQSGAQLILQLHPAGNIVVNPSEWITCHAGEHYQVLDAASFKRCYTAVKSKA